MTELLGQGQIRRLREVDDEGDRLKRRLRAAPAKARRLRLVETVGYTPERSSGGEDWACGLVAATGLRPVLQGEERTRWIRALFAIRYAYLAWEYLRPEEPRAADWRRLVAAADELEEALGVPGTRCGRRLGLGPSAVMPAPGRRLLSAGEVAECCSVSLRLVRRWIACGDLAAHRLGRAVRVAEADLERFLAARRIPGGVRQDGAGRAGAGRRRVGS